MLRDALIILGGNIAAAVAGFIAGWVWDPPFTDEPDEQ